MAQRDAENHARKVFRAVGCHVEAIPFVQRHAQEFARVSPEGEQASGAFLELLTSPKNDQLVVLAELPARASTIASVTYIVGWAA
jgi:hypothetical protein